MEREDTRLQALSGNGAPGLRSRGSGSERPESCSRARPAPRKEIKKRHARAAERQCYVSPDAGLCFCSHSALRRGRGSAPAGLAVGPRAPADAKQWNNSSWAEA